MAAELRFIRYIKQYDAPYTVPRLVCGGEGAKGIPCCALRSLRGDTNKFFSPFSCTSKIALLLKTFDKKTDAAYAVYTKSRQWCEGTWSFATKCRERHHTTSLCQQ